MDTSLLRRLRFIEGVLSNIPAVIAMWIIFGIPIYFGVSLRVTANLFLLLFLGCIIFRQRLGNLFYVRMLPFMKPLWEYEQQKFISDKWTKWRRNRKYINALLIVGVWAFIMLVLAPDPAPLPQQINWDIIIAGLVGTNIGMVWNVFTEKFYH